MAALAIGTFFAVSLLPDANDDVGIRIEAENGLLSGSMEIGADGAASNQAYVSVSGQGAIDESLEDGVHFCFNVAVAGPFEVNARILGRSDANDSIYVRVDQSSAQLWEFPRAMGYTEHLLTSETGAPIVVDLASGSHVLSFFAAEPDVKLDWIALVPTSDEAHATSCEVAGQGANALAAGPPILALREDENTDTIAAPSPETTTTLGALATSSTLVNTPTSGATKQTPTTEAAKPTTTTQTSRVTTTQPAAKPAIGGGFGAGAVGPGQEPRTTKGMYADTSNFQQVIGAAKAGEVVLLGGGSYQGFNIPNGVTVKPYDGAGVTIDGLVTMDSNSVLAGVTVRGNGSWAIHIDAGSGGKRNITVRNSNVTGGSVEAIRISRNVSGVTISGNDISGGGNHNIKVHGEGSGFKPSATIVNNRIHDPRREDAIQTQDNGPVTIDRNTFWSTPENGIDNKEGQKVTITNNLFDGTSLNEGALLVHSTANAVVVHNRFAGGTGAMLGSNGSGNPTWTFKQNLVEGGGVTLRKSTGAVVDSNVFNGGFLKMGIDGGDTPSSATVTDNYFEGTEMLDRVNGAFVCSGNSLVDVSGDWSACS